MEFQHSSPTGAPQTRRNHEAKNMSIHSGNQTWLAWLAEKNQAIVINFKSPVFHKPLATADGMMLRNAP